MGIRRSVVELSGEEPGGPRLRKMGEMSLRGSVHHPPCAPTEEREKERRVNNL